MLESTYIVTIRNEGDERAFSVEDVKLALDNEAITTLSDECLASLVIEVQAG